MVLIECFCGQRFEYTNRITPIKQHFRQSQHHLNNVNFLMNVPQFKNLVYIFTFIGIYFLNFQSPRDIMQLGNFVNSLRNEALQHISAPIDNNLLNDVLIDDILNTQFNKYFDSHKFDLVKFDNFEKPDDCDICYSGEPVDKYFKADCGHIMCYICADSWYLKESKSTCPMCRRYTEFEKSTIMIIN